MFFSGGRHVYQLEICIKRVNFAHFTYSECECLHLCILTARLIRQMAGARTSFIPVKDYSIKCIGPM